MNKAQKIAALEVENWNLKHPVGALVKLKLDNGLTKITKTRSEAYICGAGYPGTTYLNVRRLYDYRAAKRREWA